MLHAVIEPHHLLFRLTLPCTLLLVISRIGVLAHNLHASQLHRWMDRSFGLEYCYHCKPLVLTGHGQQQKL